MSGFNSGCAVSLLIGEKRNVGFLGIVAHRDGLFDRLYVEQVSPGLACSTFPSNPISAKKHRFAWLKDVGNEKASSYSIPDL